MKLGAIVVTNVLGPLIGDSIAPAFGTLLGTNYAVVGKELSITLTLGVDVVTGMIVVMLGD